MFDIRADKDRGSGVVAVGTPGAALWVSLPTFPIRGFHVVNGTLYVVAGQILYSITSAGVYTVLGVLPTANSPVSMDDNTIQLAIVDGVAGYIYTFATATLSKITDSNFPNGATSIAFLNQVFYVNTPNTRQVAQSAVLDGTTWTSQGVPIFATKESSSDNLAAVAVYNGVLFLLGNNTTEVWADVGTSPFRSQLIPGTAQNWGLAALYSRAVAGGVGFFLAANTDGTVAVVRNQGSNIVPVSTSDLNFLFKHFTTYSDAVAFSYSAYGHSVYQITFPTANRSFAYDLTTNLWHEAQTGANAPQQRHFGQLGATLGSRNLISDATTGNIYQLDENTLTDNGYTIPREVCTRNIYGEGNRMFMSRLFLDFDVGQGVQGTGASPTIMINISKDGGNTFGPEKQVQAGAVGQYTTRVRLNRLGSAYDFVVRIRQTDVAKFFLMSGSVVLEALQ